MIIYLVLDDWPANRTLGENLPTSESATLPSPAPAKKGQCPLCQHTLNFSLVRNKLEDRIDLADGFSFAQLCEVYILAGQSASDRRAEIAFDDILHAVQTLRHGFAAVKERQGAGFAPREV